jgi:hypothetical protein
MVTVLTRIQKIIEDRNVSLFLFEFFEWQKATPGSPTGNYGESGVVKGVNSSNVLHSSMLMRCPSYKVACCLLLVDTCLFLALLQCRGGRGCDLRKGCG